MMPAGNVHSVNSLKSLLQGVVDVKASDDREVHGLSLDSRNVQPGFIFFATSGTQQHGLEHVQQALNNGACAVVWEQTQRQQKIEVLFPDARKQHVPFYGVTQLKMQIGNIAEKYYANPSRRLSVIGITGTNGKTSCSQFLAKLLSENASCGVIGTLGSGLYGKLIQGAHTTPDAIAVHQLLNDFANAGATSCSMEVSSHGLDQGRVAGVGFEVAVLTNLSRDHLDYHGDMHNYAKAKRMLFEMKSIQYAVINADDAFGRQLLTELNGKCNLIAYSMIGEINVEITNRHAKDIAWVLADNIQQNIDGLVFDVNTSNGNATIKSSLIGKFNIANLLAVIATLLALGHKLDTIARKVASLHTINGRMQRSELYSHAPLVVVDYAHTPDALQNALLALREHGGKQNETPSHLWCVFGCGGDRDQGKRARMGEIANTFAGRVVVTNDNPRTESADAIINEVLSGISHPSNVTVIQDRREAIRFALENAGAEDLVLIAGKGHETYQIVGTEKLSYPGDMAVVQNLLRNISEKRQ